MQVGEDKEAFLSVYDEAQGAFLPVPGDIGRLPAKKKGKPSSCYMAVHTHRSTGGTLHLAVDSRNALLFEPVLRALTSKLNRPMSAISAVYTNGEKVSPVHVEPGMHIKVVFE